MIIVRLKNIKPGMVSSSEVKDARGRVLLGTGQAITSKHIKAFKAWGVTEVAILKAPHERFLSEKEEIPELPKKLEEEVQELFRYTDRRHPAMKELFNLHIQRKLEVSEEKGEDNGA